MNIPEIALTRLIELPAVVSRVNAWAEQRDLPRPLVCAHGNHARDADKGYRPVALGWLGHKSFRFTGFGWVFPARLQFWVEHWPEGAEQAAASKRFLMPLL
ncbi:MAG: hypothetical protein AAFR99_05745 [Cyanobacteria bacterium J06629_9]